MRPNKRISLRRDKRGFTGLEAAIVLTAFIVVAAVFSYMVLGAGFFSTEKAKAVIHTGVEKATSSAEVTGDVIGHGWLYTTILGTYNQTGSSKFTDGATLEDAVDYVYSYISEDIVFDGTVSVTNVSLNYTNSTGGYNLAYFEISTTNNGTGNWSTIPVSNLVDVVDITLNNSVNVTSGVFVIKNAKGDTYYDANNTHQSDSTNLTVVEFQVELTAGQEPMDMNKVVLSYSDEDTYAAELTYRSWGNASKGNLTMGSWSYSLATSEMGKSNMLDPNEKMTVIVALPEYGVTANKEFKIDFKPALGGSITISKTAPGTIDKTMVLK